MDEIFDRIRAIKIKKGYLRAALIYTELLGILVLIWFLRAPLYEKFLTAPPKAYSSSQMDSQKRYIMTQGDFLTGSINPENKLVILVWQNGQVQYKAKIQPGADGKWNHQLPLKLAPGVKIITFGELDKQNNILSVSNYRVRMKSRDLLNFSTGQNSGFIDSTIIDPDQVSQNALDIQESYSSSPPNTTLSEPSQE